MIYEKLSAIQNEMKVPKNLYNDYKEFYYRNAETIMETAKPICARHKATLTVEDEIVQIGNRFYVKAIATLHDWDKEESVTVSAFAREPENKSGMDDAQVTGSVSSYARKYALNGLFNLDDNKDPDEPVNTPVQKQEKDTPKATKTAQEKMITASQKKTILEYATVNNQFSVYLQGLLKDRVVDDLTLTEASELCAQIRRKKEGTLDGK